MKIKTPFASDARLSGPAPSPSHHTPRTAAHANRAKGRRLRIGAGGGMLACWLIALPVPKMEGQVLASYNPTQTATVSAPVVGVAQGEVGSEDKYLLTRDLAWTTLNTDLANEQFKYNNPSTAKDASVFVAGYMLQLGTDGGIRQIRLSTGTNPSFSLDVPSIDAGLDAFGIGFNGDKMLVGNLNGGQMTLREYDFSQFAFSDPVTFAYDASQWGIPTTLAYTTVGGQGRALIGTKEAVNEQEQIINKILDMNSVSGSIDQYVVSNLSGSAFKLESLYFDDGSLVVGYAASSEGRIQLALYNPIPEPGMAAFVLGVGAGVCAMAIRRRKKEEAEPKPL